MIPRDVAPRGTTPRGGLRRGMTIIEIIVVSAVAVVVLTVLITLSNSSAKMNKAALSSVTLSNALVVQETIATDLRQLGVLPARGPVPLLNEHGLSFFKCVFEDKIIKLRPVKYGCERTPGGNFRLIRTEVQPGKTVKHTLDGILASVKFSLVSHPQFGGVYLKVALELIDDDVKPPTSRTAYTARVTAHDVLCRIPIPTEVGHVRLQQTTKPVVEQDLLPLDPL